MNADDLIPPTPSKAYKDSDFLNGPAARNIRVLCEMTEPRERFMREKILHTVVMFGSARIVHESQAKSELAAYEKQLEGRSEAEYTEAEANHLALLRARVKASPYYQAAVELAQELTRWSMSLEDQRKRFFVCTGGGPGIMEAGNRGAWEAGGRSIALGISLPFEQGLNKWATPETSFEFHYFFVRKYWFFYLAKALIVFPGGFGTMDELFEVLTLIQTEKTRKHVPVVLFGKDFWNSILNFNALVEWGVISPGDVNLFHIVDSVEETLDIIRKDFEENFFRDPNPGESPQKPSRKGPYLANEA
jgi:uncharacterized protein (TIGR00730 family)